MVKSRKTLTGICIGLALAPALAGNAWAVDPAPSVNRNVPVIIDRGAELRAMENRLQRQQFQQEQQFNRQLDRRQLVPLQRPDVPSVQQNCNVQVFGNTYLKSCR